MDRTKLKQLLRTVFSESKKMNTELGAYERAFDALKEALKTNYPDFPTVADQLLAAARLSPVLHERMRQQYDVVLEKLLEQASRAETEEEAEKLLESLPKGPPN